MIRSMTGFGEAEVRTAAGLLRAEIRTVNHRFFSLNVRNPSALDRYEPRIKDWLKPYISRGHVNVTYRLEGENGEAGPALALEAERTEAYLRVFREMKRRFELPGEITLDMMARISELVVREQPDVAEVDEGAVAAVTAEAARGVVVMREEEGRSLHADLEGRLAAIAMALDAVAERAPGRLANERDRLMKSVRELAGEAGIDEDRLAREVAMMADRWDLSEEIVRLRSHLDHFRGMLDEDSAAPVGKRLAFLVQEMHREANTIGSKANDAAIEHRVVAIKNEIERLREQVENVE
ncbi:MAG TPA: YicC/YloC family endoribonuclease [Longimicrobiales bacterium]|nr:YicC/YloC family endoribonuclease [Longimicrobiales bacterium]